MIEKRCHSHNFLDCPAYLSKEIQNRRSGGATQEKRFIASMKILLEERKWLVQALFESQSGSGHKFRDVSSPCKMCFQHLFKELLLGNQFNNPQEQEEKESAVLKTIKQCKEDC